MNPGEEDIRSNVGVSYLPPTLSILAVFSLFSFLFHFAWEILQGPLFAEMSDARHAAATLICFKATLGDVAIALAGFTVAAWFGNGRGWYMTLPYRAVSAYVTTGVLITVVFEWYATQWAGRWAYSDLMPVIPLLRVGVAPVLQWVFPPLRCSTSCGVIILAAIGPPNSRTLSNSYRAGLLAPYPLPAGFPHPSNI